MPRGYLVHYPEGQSPWSEFVDFIAISPVEGVPPRPTPGPTPPGGGGEGIWGPTDPRPTNPIAGFDPIHGTWPELPKPPTGGSLAAVFDVPAGATPPPDPVPPNWTVKIIKEQGSDGPSWVYVGPHLQHNKPA